MPKDSFVETTHLTEPEHTQGLLDPSPDAVRITITEDMTREILRVAAFLRTVENAQDLSIGHLGDVEWLAGDALDEESLSGLPAEPSGPPEFDYDLAIDADGGILINIHADGAVALHGYVTDVQTLAAHFDLPMEPPKPTIYLVMEGGVIQDTVSDDPKTVAAALKGVTRIEYDTEGADPSELSSVIQDNGVAEDAIVADLGLPSQMTVDVLGYRIGEDEDEEASAVDGAEANAPQAPETRRRPGPR